jgi:hypothetical protein
MPTDTELLMLADSFTLTDSDSYIVEFARAVLAKYGNAPQVAQGDEVGEMLSGLIEPMQGLDKNQPGYQYRSGWNAALMRAMDVARSALSRQPSADDMAVNRYRPVPNGLLGYKVVAGDGTRSLYSGTKDSCYLVARKLTEAFLDGAFVARQPSAGDAK